MDNTIKKFILDNVIDLKNDLINFSKPKIQNAYDPKKMIDKKSTIIEILKGLGFNEPFITNAINDAGKKNNLISTTQKILQLEKELKDEKQKRDIDQKKIIDLEKQLADLKKELSDIKQKLAQEIARNAVTSAALIASQRLSERSNNNLEQTQAQLAQANTDHQATQARLAQANVDHQATQAQLAQANADHQATQAQLAQANADHNATRAQLAQTNADHQATQAQLAQANADHQATQAQLAQANADHNATRTQLADANNAHEATRAQLAEANNAHEATRVELARVNADCETIRVRLQEANANNAQLQQNNDNLVQQYNDLRREIQELSGQLIEEQSKFLKYKMFNQLKQNNATTLQKQDSANITDTISGLQKKLRSTIDELATVKANMQYDIDDLSKRLEKSKAEIDRLNTEHANQIRDLQSQIANLPAQSALELLRADIGRETEEKKALERQLRGLTAQHELKLKECNDKLTPIEEQLRVLTESNTAKDARINELITENRTLIAQKENYRGQLERLQADIQQIKDTNAELKVELDKQNIKINGLNTQIAQNQGVIDDAIRIRDSNSSPDIKRIQQKLDDAIAERDRLSAQLATEIAEKTRLQVQERELKRIITQISGELQIETNKNKNLETRITELQTEIRTLRENCDTQIKRLTTELTLATESQRQLQLRVTELETELARLRMIEQQKKDCDKELANMKAFHIVSHDASTSKYDDVVKENKQLTAELTQVKTNITRITAELTAEKEKTRTLTENTQKEKEALITTHNAKIAELNARIAGLEQDKTKEAITNENTTLRAQIVNLNTEVRTLNEDKIEVNRQIAELNARITTLNTSHQTEITKLNGQIAIHEATKNELNATIAGLRTEIQTQKTTIVDLTEQLEQAQQRIKECNENKRICEEELARIRRELQTKEAENTELKAENAELKAQIKKLQDDCNKEIARLKGINAELTRTLSEKDAIIGELNARIAEIISKNEAQIQLLDAQIKALGVQESTNLAELRASLEAERNNLLSKKDEEIAQLVTKRDSLISEVKTQKDIIAKLQADNSSKETELKELRQQLENNNKELEKLRRLKSAPLLPKLNIKGRPTDSVLQHINNQTTTTHRRTIIPETEDEEEIINTDSSSSSPNTSLQQRLYQTSINQLQETNEQLEKKISELEKQLRDEQYANNKCMSDKALLNVDKNEANSKIRSLQQQLDEANAKIKDCDKKEETNQKANEEIVKNKVSELTKDLQKRISELESELNTIKEKQPTKFAIPNTNYGQQRFGRDINYGVQNSIQTGGSLTAYNIVLLIAQISMATGNVNYYDHFDYMIHKNNMVYRIPKSDELFARFVTAFYFNHLGYPFSNDLNALIQFLSTDAYTLLPFEYAKVYVSALPLSQTDIQFFKDWDKRVDELLDAQINVNSVNNRFNPKNLLKPLMKVTTTIFNKLPVDTQTSLQQIRTSNQSEPINKLNVNKIQVQVTNKN